MSELSPDRPPQPLPTNGPPQAEPRETGKPREHSSGLDLCGASSAEKHEPKELNMAEVPSQQHSIYVHGGFDTAQMDQLVPTDAQVEASIQQGSTAHFVVSYDPRLANGAALADAVLETCEADYNRLQGWFGNINIGGLPFSVLIKPGSNGARHNTCFATGLSCDAFNGNDADLERSLVVAEEDEVFMANQGAGWDCDASNGEALSRVLAVEIYPNELNPPGVGSFATGPSWLLSNRPDWVSKTDPTAGTGPGFNPVSIGCGTLFINWLHYQLGYSLNSIVQAGGTTLQDTYQVLTGSANAFGPFLALLNENFPPGTPVTLRNDNPFPMQQIIPGTGGTSDSPAMTVFNGRLYVAWKGAGGDERLFYNSSRDGVNFTNQQILPGTGGTGASPTLAVFNGRLYVAWKGAGGDERLFYNSSRDGVDFTNQQILPGTGGSSASPALAASNAQLYVAWKGAGGDERLFYNSSRDGVNFTGQQIIPGTGGTGASPTLAVFNGRLYVAWKGAGGDERLFYNIITS